MNKIIGVEGGREGRELCERERWALAVSRVICPLISLTVRSNQDYSPLLSVLFLFPIPISFYYSLTICISLSSSKAALFWECSIRKRWEAGDGLEDKVLGLVHGVSLLKRVIAVVCENIAFLRFRLKYFPLCNSCRKISMCVLMNESIFTDGRFVWPFENPAGTQCHKTLTFG